MTRLEHDDLLALGWAIAVALVALGTAIAIAAVRELTPWRWS